MVIPGLSYQGVRKEQAALFSQQHGAACIPGKYLSTGPHPSLCELRLSGLATSALSLSHFTSLIIYQICKRKQSQRALLDSSRPIILEPRGEELYLRSGENWCHHQVSPCTKTNPFSKVSARLKICSELVHHSLGREQRSEQSAEVCLLMGPFGALVPPPRASSTFGAYVCKFFLGTIIPGSCAWR